MTAPKETAPQLSASVGTSYGPTIQSAHSVAYIEIFFDLISILALTQLSRHLFDNQSLIGCP
ncbi:hypothetical protein SAMN05216368_11841 [Cryobacterium flavum]|uniref:Uncharacterized protein n=1 Tax=Cryobacterium flavum TaxID=1424659 RepID=A0A4R8UYC6_9MICO|nr:MULTISPECIES: hypothetical protein [Cryobacterium]TFB72891.1 hypothetical protein E3O21_17445 [Cryobacterium flavum]SDO44058.1 hypothetical protein SAMN05216368_11841 [Cryobacterium flavum]